MKEKMKGKTFFPQFPYTESVKLCFPTLILSKSMSCSTDKWTFINYMKKRNENSNGKMPSLIFFCERKVFLYQGIKLKSASH